MPADPAALADAQLVHEWLCRSQQYEMPERWELIDRETGQILGSVTRFSDRENWHAWDERTPRCDLGDYLTDHHAKAAVERKLRAEEANAD